MRDTQDDTEGIDGRVEWLTEELGRQPTLDEVFYRDFTGTGRFRVLELGRPAKPRPRGRRSAR